jgi:hypothetical protein
VPGATPRFAPIGEVESDGPHVRCHLCGRWFRSVLRHLPSHGWDQRAYREAFGLERGQALEGADTRRRRAEAMSHRRLHDPAVRAGTEIGERRARSGMLSREAAEAARGRRQSARRRHQSLRGLDRVSARARAAGAKAHADERLHAVAAEAAARLGHPGVGSLVRARVAAGAGLAAVSREMGLHKDWLSRHLVKVDPAVAAEIAPAVRAARGVRADALWFPRVHELGFAGVGEYLADRLLARGFSISAVAAESGMSRPAVSAARRRHGVAEVLR